MPANVPTPFSLELVLPENFTEADLKAEVNKAISNKEFVTELRNAQPTQEVTLTTHKQFPSAGGSTSHIKKRPKK